MKKEKIYSVKYWIIVTNTWLNKESEKFTNIIIKNNIEKNWFIILDSLFTFIENLQISKWNEASFRWGCVIQINWKDYFPYSFDEFVETIRIIWDITKKEFNWFIFLNILKQSHKYRYLQLEKSDYDIFEDIKNYYY